MSKNARIAALIGGAVALAISGFLLAKPGNDSSTSSTPSTTTSVATTPSATTTQTTTTATPEPAVQTVVVKSGKPVGGVAKLSIGHNKTMRLVVTSDTDGQVHLHGYDIEKEVGPGAPARFTFKADITGRFEVELHPSTQIAQLDVTP